MAEKVLIVKYGEIAMRGNNKYIFINWKDTKDMSVVLAIR